LRRGFFPIPFGDKITTMKTASLPPKTEAAVWLRILHPNGEFTPEVAEAILQLAIPPDDKARMHDLSVKARAGTLTTAEEEEMDSYERAGALLSTLKSQARQTLKKSGRKS
jgi:hypothetical protein